MTVSP
jgi:hypothetical protein